MVAADIGKRYKTVNKNRADAGARIRTIFQVAFPLIIQGMVFQLQSLTDKAFLGNLDTVYVSAAGAGQRDKIADYVKSMAVYHTMVGILVFAAWFFGAETILRFFQVDSNIMGYSLSYVRVCIFYFLFVGVDSSLQAMLQGMGETRPIMYAGILKAGLNILVSWILIFGKCGFPALYVTGAALLFLSFPRPLLGIFSNDGLLIEEGAVFLIMIGVIMIPQSMNVICGNAIRVNGDTKWMLFSQIFGSILVISVSWFLVEKIHMNMMAIYITLFLDEAVRGAINFLYYRARYGKMTAYKLAMRKERAQKWG